MSGEINKEFVLLNNLAEIRKERGLSQTDLGTMVHLSRQTISSIERNCFDPTLYTAMILCNALGVEVTDVFRLEELNAQNQRNKV